VPKKPNLEELNPLLQHVAVEILSLTLATVGKKKWKAAYLDERSGEDESRIAKFRVELPNGNLMSGDITREINKLVRTIWAMRPEQRPEKWYGMKLTLQPDGQCKTEFNYDPEYINDPTFFDFDE